MFHGPGVVGIILIVIVALLVFGPNKLPELGRAFGKTLHEFKKGAKDIMDDVEDTQTQQQPPRELKPPIRKEIRSEDVIVHQTEQSTDDQQTPNRKRRLPD
ncbi:twin-arginine translocase TatA/TatE family subunit [Gorillibacterium massiliense]|uniref:twin-arginine translocase TatA/TatE family subunit n=1 Tax=Gorillibacterium massiliense TaxID=1280390 RepID=UPI0004B63D72|nr:twin-arginine translocase TatA/TatE family subunit [Gorillibacterium massiliense]